MIKTDSGNIFRAESDFYGPRGHFQAQKGQTKQNINFHTDFFNF